MYTIQKVNCTKHPSEQLNNFCRNSNCQIALCATCIGEHTQNHLKQGTNPIYSNIKDVVIELNKQLQRYVDKSRDLLNRITDIMQKIQNKQTTLRELMSSIRNEATQFLNQRLYILQQQLVNQINNESQKFHLHNFSRMQYLAQKVKTEKNIYNQYLQQLKKPQIAHNIRTISENLLNQSYQLISNIGEQVAKNEQVQSGFIYNQDKLKQSIIKGVQNAVVYFKNSQFTPQMNISAKINQFQKSVKSRPQINIQSYNSINSPPKYIKSNKLHHMQNFTCQPSGNSSMRESITFSNTNSVNTPMSPHNRKAYMTAYNFFNPAMNQNSNLIKQTCNRTISGTSSVRGNFRPFINRNQ